MFYRSVRFPLLDEAGEPYGVCGISTDISERKDTERSLHEAQQRFVSALVNAPTGMAVVGPDGRFRQVNEALCELTGRTEEQLLSMALTDTIHPEEWAARKKLFERMLTGEIRTHQTQGRLLTRDNEARWVCVNEDWPTEFFIQFQDITEQTPCRQLLAGEPVQEKTDLDLGVLRQLTAETGGEQDPKLIRDLASLFREDSSRGLKQVADALRQRDAQGVARAAHALKGSSGQLGATRTEAISAELQAVAETGELKDAKALLRRLETAVDAAQSALSSALPEGAAK